MTVDSGYPVSLLLEGPLFIDELETHPQHFKQEHEIDSLRLVPSKSAASGVRTIYFRPDHRQWALVRLATRYRGLFEIQLHRGMSGEHQLLRQGFTSNDLQFLSDIFPRPPKEYNPIVYDMLWLVATYDEYLTLAKSMDDQGSFVPKTLLKSTEGLSIDDDGFFTRFLRSHLIRPEVRPSDNGHRRSNQEKPSRTVDLIAKYEVTSEGREALEGIVTEYERIFEQQDFEPLLINPELNPLEHLEEYQPEPEEPAPEVSIDEVKDESGILGEIAESFAPIDEELDSSPDNSDATRAGNHTEQAKSGEDDDPNEELSTEVAERDERSSEVSVANRGESVDRVVAEGQNGQQSAGGTTAERGHGTEGTTPGESDPETSMVGEFSRDEVVQAAAAAAGVIHDNSLVRTADVKAAAWESVDLSDRSRGSLWETVRDVLVAMDDVHGREGGHVWTSSAPKDRV